MENEDPFKKCNNIKISDKMADIDSWLTEELVIDHLIKFGFKLNDEFKEEYKESKKDKIDETLEFFGLPKVSEYRGFTKEEAEKYNRGLKNIYVATGINVFDLMKDEEEKINE